MRRRIIADCAALLPLASSACKAMDEGDGMARQIGGWVTVYPVFFGPIDLAKDSVRTTYLTIT